MSLEINWDEFTFRCSSLGNIMSEPKCESNLDKYNKARASYTKHIEAYNLAKAGTKMSEKAYASAKAANLKLEKLDLIKNKVNLSDTCKTHLSDIYTRVVYDRTEDLKSKYLEKGLLMEEDAITMYSLLTGDYFEKNTERKENGFIQGEMDFSTIDMAVDTKVNWSIFQFQRVVSKPIKPLYEWQLRGYMWLYRKSKGRLVYCLLNTPEHLIKREQTKFMYEVYGREIDMTEKERADFAEACIEITRNHTYDDMPLEERVKIFDINQSDEYEDRIIKRVQECREYLKDFKNLNTITDDTDGDDEVED